MSDFTHHKKSYRGWETQESYAYILRSSTPCIKKAEIREAKGLNILPFTRESVVKQAERFNKYSAVIFPLDGTHSAFWGESTIGKHAVSVRDLLVTLNHDTAIDVACRTKDHITGKPIASNPNHKVFILLYKGIAFHRRALDKRKFATKIFDEVDSILKRDSAAEKNDRLISKHVRLYAELFIKQFRLSTDWFDASSGEKSLDKDDLKKWKDLVAEAENCEGKQFKYLRGLIFWNALNVMSSFTFDTSAGKRVPYLPFANTTLLKLLTVFKKEVIRTEMAKDKDDLAPLLETEVFKKTLA